MAFVGNRVVRHDWLGGLGHELLAGLHDRVDGGRFTAPHSALRGGHLLCDRRSLPKCDEIVVIGELLCLTATDNWS